MTDFDIIDTGDSAEEEARQIAARRMFMYSARALLAADEVDRKYVLFPELKVVLEALDRSYQLALRVNRPQGILVSGPPGSSKSSIAEYFQRSLPTSTDIIEGHGALRIRLRSNPCAGGMVSHLLRAVRHPFTTIRQGRFWGMRDIAFEALQQLGTRVIFVDQAHVLEQSVKKSTRATKGAVETTASEVLRDLMDETGIALVFLASDTFGGLERVDEALADRVSVRLSLRYFDDDAVWCKFLSEIGKRTKCIDFKLLSDRGFAALTHRAALGNRRRTKLLLTEAVLVAIDSGANAVAREHFETAFQRISGASNQVLNPYASA
ncbi:TniB family NTP-binding protein [Roseateles sp.]|uniref:TniB family NTP-binding protein n=1 Tax=Roseateles sp. TaxID=1971397 RepID=UPI0025CE0C8D|nr:TniB family NTP-binding protein [Roseateles sp.]MBV8033658.1 TniB family NTP-binding protein [Roseateles sp.]